MAEGDVGIYNHFKEQVLLKAIDMDTDQFKVILLGSGYSYSPDGNNGYANISANEISTSGYTANTKALASLTVTQDDTNDRAKWDAANVTWTSLGTTTIAHAVIHDETVTAPVADPLVCRVEIGTNSNGNNYTISWHANGIFYLA